MIRQLKSLPIRYQLGAVVAMFILGIVVVLAVSYSKISGIMVDRNDQYVRDILTQSRKTVADNCDSVGRILSNIAYDATVQQFLSTLDPLEQFDLSRKLERLFINMTGIRAGIRDILVDNLEGSHFALTMPSVDVPEMVSPADGVSIRYSELKAGSLPQNRQPFFIAQSQSFAVAGDRNGDRRIGLISLCVDAESLGPDVAQLGGSQGSHFYLLDRRGTVFSSNDKERVGEAFPLNRETLMGLPQGSFQTIHGIRYKVCYDTLPAMDGMVVALLEESTVLRGLAETRTWVLTVFVLILVALSVPLYFTAQNISTPLVRFQRFIRTIRSGDLRNMKTRIQLSGCAEITEMADEFNALMDEINTLTRQLLRTNSRLYEIELLKKQSELGFLRSQINPHFLYNTLESMKSIASIRGVSEVRVMAMSLAAILRYSIKGPDFVPLSREVEIIRGYMDIQQIRFNNRFTLEVCLDEAMLHLPVARMILQPIVENAIYHGLEPKSGTGHLVVSGAPEGGCLRVTIRDDGVGFEADVLENVRARLEATGDGPERVDESGSVGLANVHQRLRLVYGTEAGLTVESHPGGGTEVSLRIPWRREQNV